MPDDDEYEWPPEQKRLHEILMKVVTYQHSLSDDRAVEMAELRSEDVLSQEDFEFLTHHSVTYKPHRRNVHHGGDMFHMPKENGCVFLGPSGPPLVKRGIPLSAFQTTVLDFLNLPKPKDELLLHIYFTENDGMGVSHQLVSFNLKSENWRIRLAGIRSVASEFGFHPFQDEEVQGSWILSFGMTENAERIAAAVFALLSRGCGFSDDSEIIYSAGALDEDSEAGTAF